MNRPCALALGIVALGGCSEAPIGGPAAARAPPAATVMTRNLYLGAPLSPLFRPDLTPQQVPGVVAQLFAEILATNFPERAGRLAAEIATARPHLVGLQEVEFYRTQTPGDAFLPGGGTPAADVAIDFLQTLLDSLQGRGLRYRTVAAVTNVDAEAPAATGVGPTGMQDIRLTDRDVILAREDVPISNPLHANYTARLVLPVGGNPMPVVRGWTSVVATLAGSAFRFVNTHLEIEVAPQVQEAQAQELIDLLRSETRPIILVGDFNSAANVFETRSYAMLTGAGFVDAWAQEHPPDMGLTCCQTPDLRNATTNLDRRLDIVFWRDASNARTGRTSRTVGAGGGGGAGAAHVDIVGEELSDRTPSGLWPSNHAGVVATLGR